MEQTTWNNEQGTRTLFIRMKSVAGRQRAERKKQSTENNQQKAKQKMLDFLQRTHPPSRRGWPLQKRNDPAYRQAGVVKNPLFTLLQIHPNAFLCEKQKTNQSV